MTYYKTYCLVCGDQSDSDIGLDDVLDWEYSHTEDSPHPEDRAFQRVTDGAYVEPRRSNIAGFKVGDAIDLTDSYARSLSEEQWPQPITGFAILGYQGIVALTGTGGDGGAYLDHITVVDKVAG